METHQPCPACGSHDALTIYEDGHSYCFSCNTYFRSSKEEKKLSSGLKKQGLIDLQDMVVSPLPKRKLTKQTCAKYGYFTSKVHGQPVQVACYYDDDNKLLGQKIRYADKTFEARGSFSERFFGQHLFQGGGKKLVITEGEIDCLTVSQVQGNKYPVVSIPTGAASAAKVFRANFNWLESFEEVIVMFDMDAAGRKAVKAVSGILSPNKLKIAWLPCKDPNECLQEGKSDAVVKAVWEAKTYTPADIIKGDDLWEVLSKHEESLNYPLPWDIPLQNMTDGLRKGELVVITAGTGIGKTTFVRQLAYHLGTECYCKVGMLMLEENVKHTANGLVCLKLGKPTHRPIVDSEYKKAFEDIMDNFVFYNHFGSIECEDLLQTIRYMVTGEQVDFVVLDHISIAISGLDIENERKATDVLMTKLRSLVEETGVGMLVVSHLRRTDGTPAEEGGALSLSHLRGSQAISQLSDAVWGLERNQQDEGVKKNLVRVRVLKNRYSGDTGIAGYLAYDKEHNILNAVKDLSEYEAPVCPFNTDETEKGDF
jgi:twinkle protein